MSSTLEYMRQYRKKHAVEIRAADAKWKAKHRKELAEYQRRQRLAHKETYASYNRKYRDAHKERIVAVALVNYAIRKGRILRPVECSKCLSGGRIDAHHEDYSKPMDIVWLCRSCHKLADVARRARLEIV